jgi:reverse gyrase
MLKIYLCKKNLSKSLTSFHAPTSSGKTFIGEMFAIHHCLKHKKVLYFVLNFVLMLYKTTKGCQKLTKTQNFYFSEEKLKFLGF